MPTQHEVQPLVIKDMRLRVDADNFEKHCSSVTFTPSSSQIEWRGGTPDAVFTDSTTPTWTVAIEYAQDWESDESLSQYLFENGGTTKAMEFAPASGVGKKTFSVNASIQPGAIGGAVGAYSAASVTLGCDKPVIGTATADDEPTEDPGE